MPTLLMIPTADDRLDCRRRPLQLAHPACIPRTVRLWCDPDGGLTYSDVSVHGDRGDEGFGGMTLVGLLHYARCSGAGDCGTQGRWYLVCSSPLVSLDTLAPPLSLTALDPGSILSIGLYSWLIAHRWSAQPAEVPEEFKDESCPICGGLLALAPVVRCYCGRLLHLQLTPQQRGADDGGADDILDCFLKAGDCRCGIEATLAPQILPVRARRLFEESESPGHLLGSSLT